MVTDLQYKSKLYLIFIFNHGIDICNKSKMARQMQVVAQFSVCIIPLLQQLHKQ